MKVSGNIGKTLLTAGVAFGLTACHSTQNLIKLPNIVRAEQHLDEWGSATASVPVISIPSDDFKFALNKTTEQYYDNAKQEINAGIAQHTQTVFSFLFAASSQNDVINQGAFSEQLKQYEDKLQKANASPDLSDDEKEALKADAMALLDEYKKAAKANFDSCNDIADLEKEAAKAAETTDEKLKLTSSTVDRRQSCLDSYQAELASLNPSSPIPQYPDYADDNVPALSRLQNQPFLAQEALNDSFSDKDNSILGSAFAIPDHTAIPQAATNKFLSDMFKSISDNKDGSAYFGVTMVSINPGWRTTEDYNAVVNMEPSIVYDKASKSTTDKYLANKDINKELRAAIAVNYQRACEEFDFASLCNDVYTSFVNKTFPLSTLARYEDLLNEKFDVQTTALSPVTYGQTLDLQNRQISQINLSLMLAASLRAAGVGEAAELFASYSRERRKEFGSRNSLNNVSVFSSGTTVGVEIAPEFFAANPNNNDSEERLQAQTFPMLIRLEAVDKDNWRAPSVAHDCDRKPETYDICLVEPKFQFVTTSRWKIKERPFWGMSTAETVTTEDLFNIKAGVYIDCSGYENEDEFVEAKCEEIRSKLFGQVNYVSLPKAAEKQPMPEFSHVYPEAATIPRDASDNLKVLSQQFVLLGNNLKQFAADDGSSLTSRVKTLFKGQKVKKAELIGGKLVVDAEISEVKGPLIFTVEHGGQTISTGHASAAIPKISIQPKRPTPSAKTPTQFTIDRDKDNGGVQVTLSPGSKDIPDNTGKVIEVLFNQKNNASVLSSQNASVLDIRAKLGCPTTNTRDSATESGDNLEKCDD